jgi:hypothetical protein
MEMRWLTAAPTCSVGAWLLVAAVTGCAPATEPAAAHPTPAVAPGGSAGAIPGTDPAIQRWFLDSGAAKIAVNDALLRAERGVAEGTAAECKPLSSALQKLSGALPKLAAVSPAGQRLAAAIQPPLATFDTAATACLAKNFAAARTALDAGVVQQADAQATVDEILDGDL